MTRSIRPHKGGRTARAPDARLTPQERGRLDTVLERRGAKYVDWLVGHVEEDYAQGDDRVEPGTVVTFKARNPITKSTFIGVVAGYDDDGTVLIYQGMTQLPNASDKAPIGGYTVISRPESELTVINPYK